MTPAQFRRFALALRGSEEQPHFERTSFRVAKKIFATMTKDGGEAMIPVRPLTRCFELLESHPDAFFSYGGWTQRHGSLGIRLAAIDSALKPLVETMMREAWTRIAP